MSFTHQFVDIVVSGVIAGLSAFLFSAVVPQFAVTIGVILASMYYFSRNPWGSQRGGEINDQVDEFYERYLPF